MQLDRNAPGAVSYNFLVVAARGGQGSVIGFSPIAFPWLFDVLSATSLIGSRLGSRT
jgi:hypothetical protein